MPSIKHICFLILLYLAFPAFIFAQGITTAQISGYIFDEDQAPLAKASIKAEHLPSGTHYLAISTKNGRYILPNLRVGGPYKLSVSHLGYQNQIKDSISLSLGQQFQHDFNMSIETFSLATVGIAFEAQRGKGSVETAINESAVQYLPSINRSILDFTRLTPSAGSFGFAGKGSRDNFISIDGSAFNNAFGLGGSTASLIGNLVGAEPISLDAIQEISIHLAPFDVRQGGFTGASINTITRSGDNQFRGSVYTYLSNESLVGSKVKDLNLTNEDFSQSTYGIRLGGPIIRNKLFFFFSYEGVRRSTPSSNFLAAKSGLSGDNITRVLASDLDDLSDFLLQEFNYKTGPYEGYKLSTQNDKFLLKLNWNINPKHKFSLRYNHLNASQESRTSNSASFGAGNRVNNLFSMSYQNSDQIRKVNSRSIVAELNSLLGNNFSNRIIAGYSYFPDVRETTGELFPSVDILQGGQTYISFGSHLFASNNSVKQKIYQFQDDFSLFLDKHTITTGVSLEYFQFEYNFTPAWAGSFIFNSLEDFYNSTPIGTLTPIGLSNGIGRPSTYARRYSALPDEALPLVNPNYLQLGIFLQDEYVWKNFQVSGGLRLDVTSFPKKPSNNTEIEKLTFQDENGNPEHFRTDQLSGSTLLFSPRLGFQWHLSQDRVMKLRGGSGIFTGRTPFIRISDQFANNGLLQGEIKARNNAANRYPFNPDPNAYVPDDRNAASTYEVNLTNSDFKMPQIWRTNIGFDLPLNASLIASVDLLHSREINRDIVRNANLEKANSTNGPDGRLQFADARLNNPPVLAAYVLDNTDQGNQTYFTLQLKRPFRHNWMANLSYTFGQAKDISSFNASTARTAFRSLPVNGNSNVPALAFSDNDLRHRILGTLAFRKDWAKVSTTTLALFFEATQRGRFSYTYSGRGDLNKDGVPSNDLIFVPENSSQIDLEAYHSNGQTISIEEQWNALDQFLTNSNYLQTRRGLFAERNGSILPWFFQMDLRLLQDININISGKKNTIQFSLDIINLANLLNNSWGIRYLPANQQPIEARQNGRFRVNPTFLDEEFITDNGIISRWQMQFGIRYIFN